MSAEYRSIVRRRTSTEHRSYVGGISVNCRGYIGHLSVVYRSTVACISVVCKFNRWVQERASEWQACTDSSCGFGGFSRFVVSFVVSFDVQNGTVCLSVDQLHYLQWTWSSFSIVTFGFSFSKYWTRSIICIIFQFTLSLLKYNC